MVLFFYAFLSGRETVKAYRLSCCNHYLCHVEGLLLKGRFLKFRVVGALIRPMCVCIYTPSRSVPGDADRATLCPMGSRCPGLNAVFRMPSAVANENCCAFLRHIAQLFTFPYVCIMSTP